MPLMAVAPGVEGGAMAPHCDAMDGPVVTAARAALEAHDVGLVLPFVHDSGLQGWAHNLHDAIHGERS
jgi:hypothetical protein